MRLEHEKLNSHEKPSFREKNIKTHERQKTKIMRISKVMSSQFTRT